MHRDPLTPPPTSAMDDHFERVLSAPPPTAKRSADDHADASARSKRRRDAEPGLSREKIAQLLAQGDANEVEDLDARALKAMGHALDKAIRKNAMMRSKHSDDPSKFMESEVQLDEELTKWKAVAAQPMLYEHLVEFNIVALLLGLFSHENLDVRLDVINLLADLTDLDEDPTALAPTKALVQHLVAHDFLPLLVRTLDDLDRDVQERSTKKDANVDRDANDDEVEPSDTGIYHALQIVENMVDVDPEVAKMLGKSTQIFSVLLRMVAHKREFSTNKLYSSEILSILVQADNVNRERFLQQSGGDGHLDRLLQALAPYRKRDPRGEEEEELVENLVNTLCTLLFEQIGQDQFRRLEGLELMLRFMKDRKLYVFTGALRVLDHALMNSRRNCEHFIEIGGLKALFPLFMGKRAAKKKEMRTKEVESVTSLIASLCLLVPKDAKNDGFARLHAKFVENDFEKLDRAVDLFAKYYERVRAADLRATRNQDDEDELVDEDEHLVRLLDAGLFVLQRVALVTAHMCQFSRKNRAYVMIKFHERNLDVESLALILREQLESLGADGATATNDEEAKPKDAVLSSHIRELLEVFDGDDDSLRDEDHQATSVSVENTDAQ